MGKTCRCLEETGGRSFRRASKVRKEVATRVRCDEELLWFQNSREEWLSWGDRNTKFYHASTIIRRSMNKIEALKDSKGDWIADPAGLENLVLDYFKSLFTKQVGDQRHIIFPQSFPRLSNEQDKMLKKPFSTDEIKTTLFDMASFKALGIDGMHAGFFQSSWEIVGESLCKFV